MELLIAGEGPGYPTEYLLSRIRGRRPRLIRDWKTLIAEADPLEFLSSGTNRGIVRERTPEGLWRGLMTEYGWVYRQMNERLRSLFGPFFFYSELRTLFICLRYIETGKADKTGNLLAASLLAEPIADILRRGADAAAVLDNLERALAELSGEFEGLGTVYEQQGLRGVEQWLTNRYLRYVAALKLHPLMRAFFRRLIDARNILSLYKALRMKRGDDTIFIPGGTIATGRLSGLLEEADLFSVIALIKETAGIAVKEPDPAKVETGLYRGITRFLRREARDPLGAGLILDYLWRCSIEVMNLTVLLYGKDLEREAVAAELVQ
jgi:hypothetical protein